MILNAKNGKSTFYRIVRCRIYREGLPPAESIPKAFKMEVRPGAGFVKNGLWNRAKKHSDACIK